MASIGLWTNFTSQPAIIAGLPATQPTFSPRPRDRYGSPS